MAWFCAGSNIARPSSLNSSTIKKGIPPMKTYLTYAVLLGSLVGLWALFASARGTRRQTGKDNPAEEEVRRLNAQEVEAFLHNDPKTMARLWSDDLVVTNPLN